MLKIKCNFHLFPIASETYRLNKMGRNYVFILLLTHPDIPAKKKEFKHERKE